MMRKFTATALFVLLTMAIFSTVYASNGTQIGNVGARSTAMASCFRGLADDWSAVFFNPAGLTQLGTKWTIGASAGLIMPSGSYNAHPYPDNHLQFGGMYTDERNLVDKTFFVPAGGIFFKPSSKITVGLGVYAPFGLGTEWDLLTVPDGYMNTNAISKENEHFSDHQVITVQPTVAFKLSEKISLGIGLSYIWGKMILDQVKLPAITTPMPMRIITETGLDGDGSTFGANVGLLFAFSQKFQCGLSGRFALSDLSLDGDVTFSLNPPTGNITQTGTVEADLPLPWTIGAGFAYKPSNRLTLTADVSMTNWESWGDIVLKVDGITHPLTQEAITELTMEENWENTIEAGFGLEFKAMDSESKQLFLRGGFYTVDTPAPDETMSPTILDPNRRYVFTGGLGLSLSKVSFNVAAEYIMFSEKDVQDYVFGPQEEGWLAENYAGLYNFSAFVFTFGTSIHL